MYWTALFLGFVGSLHCVVMCGPIALSMAGQQSLSRFLISRLLYNMGRIVTYAGIGLVFGLLGEWVALGGYQQAFSIVIGLFMILLAIGLSSSAKGKLYQPLYKLTQGLKNKLGKWIKSSKLMGTFFFGVLNGFLPCGLVYAAVAGALATTDLSNGLWYMVVFGLGTVPAMLFISISGRAFKSFSFVSFTRLSTFFVFVLGCLLVIRGLNLNIPYLSPAIAYLYPTTDITVCR
ncbi:sulfite exporter TauE/SafE family protein [Reichenbachiella carrageenanivorans]|uniref:Sulfite exporter TauE/SafE family protein n=1 Tax=Reichenbachiella carrageenanivorans TaxID=2979869 RepID=A0ABY6CX48_9BACT|nr:sulfite exporter TauE/SafE family protein [Reichenbachiella carrageenanivorans]UXX78487.1 sulfite exporter TauE/SafE family protein [Reichenbachiella carrageenanivorans]